MHVPNGMLQIYFKYYKIMTKGFSTYFVETITEVNDMMRENFSSLTDVRQQAQVRHNLFEIIAMTIVGVLANCDGWHEIEDFCRHKEAWLRDRLGLALEH